MPPRGPPLTLLTSATILTLLIILSTAHAKPAPAAYYNLLRGLDAVLSMKTPPRPGDLDKPGDLVADLVNSPVPAPQRVLKAGGAAVLGGAIEYDDDWLRFGRHAGSSGEQTSPGVPAQGSAQGVSAGMKRAEGMRDDDYGMWRYGKRARDYDDYGHMRFGRAVTSDSDSVEHHAE